MARSTLFSAITFAATALAAMFAAATAPVLRSDHGSRSGSRRLRPQPMPALASPWPPRSQAAHDAEQRRGTHGQACRSVQAKLKITADREPARTAFQQAARQGSPWSPRLDGKWTADHSNASTTACAPCPQRSAEMERRGSAVEASTPRSSPSSRRCSIRSTTAWATVSAPAANMVHVMAAPKATNPHAVADGQHHHHQAGKPAPADGPHTWLTQVLSRCRSFFPAS